MEESKMKEMLSQIEELCKISDGISFENKKGEIKFSVNLSESSVGSKDALQALARTLSNEAAML